MPDPKLVSNHYGRGDLLESISMGVDRLGKTPATLTTEDLAPVDEFHIGGSVATRSFLEQLELAAEEQVLDIGCGIGGATRFAAEAYGCRVTGIDLTDEYVETGRVLCSWVGLEENVDLAQGDATSMDFPSETFDKAFMLHVGMNIPDKEALATEAWRVLRPGGVFGIYDVMRTGEGELTFPVPWAAEPSGSSLASPAEYRDALVRAGFALVGERDRGEFALTFFEALKTARGDEGPPPLGLHILMGPDAPRKVENMIENIAQGLVSPVEVIARKPPPVSESP